MENGHKSIRYAIAAVTCVLGLVGVTFWLVVGAHSLRPRDAIQDRAPAIAKQDNSTRQRSLAVDLKSQKRVVINAGTSLAVNGDWTQGDPGIELRLEESSGAPCTNLEGRALDGPTGTRLHFRTDFEGRVRWTANYLASGVIHPKTLYLESAMAGALGAGEISPIVLELPSSWPATACDFGTRTVERRSVLLSGRVTNDQGLPISSVSVALQQRRGGGVWEVPEDLSDLSGRRKIGFATTANDGLFVLFGAVRADEYRLLTGGLGYQDVIMPLLAPPWSSVTIELAPAGSVAGVVLVDQSIPSLLQASVSRHGEAMARVANLTGGRLWMDGLAPGEYNIGVKCPGSWTYSWAEAITVLGGGTTELPVLDLRGRLSFWSVVPTTKDGVIVRAELVLATYRDGLTVAGSFQDTLGVIPIIATRGETRKLLIEAVGYEPEPIDLVGDGGEVRIVLSPKVQ